MDSNDTIFFIGIENQVLWPRKSPKLLFISVFESGFFPVDALHGDIGILCDKDILVLFSTSGNTEELLKFVPCAKAKGVYWISVTYLQGNALMGFCDLNVFCLNVFCLWRRDDNQVGSVRVS